MNKIFRLVIAGLVLTFAVYLFIDGQIGNGIMLTLIAGLVVFTYFRNENILISFWHMRKNNFEKAEKSLDRVKNPEKALTRGQQAYWYMLKGMIESQRGIGKAESLLRKSLNIGLRMKHDQAMAKLQLAGIAIAKRRKREAMVLLTEVKKLDNRGLLNDQVKMLKQQMKRI